MKKLEPILSSIFLKIKSSMENKTLNNHPYFKNSSPKEFNSMMEMILEAFSRDILEINDIDLAYPPFHEESFREGWIKNWVKRYFGTN